jgi:tRNA nucleotidyltransferase (CCA-adding enzyme)
MNLTKRMKEQFPERVMALLERIGALAASQGARAYLVGGPVRDLILGVDNLDLDITVEGDAMALGRQLAHQLGSRIYSYKKYLTCTVKGRDFKIDFATARKESYEKPAAMPKVKPGTLRDDLRRRDFTINAMAVSLSPRDFGALIDPFGGLRDLGGKIVRVMHGRSFVDDPTRIFRAIRFSGRLGFRMDPRTLSLARSAVAHGMTDRLENYRIHNELNLIMKEKNNAKIFKALDAFMSGRGVR